MKKFLAVILTMVLMMTGVVTAGAEDSEDTAHAIFDNLANIYDASLYYLTQRQITWDNTLNAKVNDVSPLWFTANITTTTNTERGLSIYAFATVNGYQDPYEDLFIPLLDAYGYTDAGLQKAVFAFIDMVFHDGEGDKAKLEEQKAAIKELMSSDPDYEYLKALQELYKKTSQIVDYTLDSTDSYVNTSSRISDYEQVRREQKSEFDFAFDWPEFNFRTKALSGVQAEIINNYYASQNAAAESAYQTAVALEEDGKYASAWAAFKGIAEYKDSTDHAIACAQKLMESPSGVHTHVKYYKNGTIVSTATESGTDTTYTNKGDNIEVEKIYWRDNKDIKDRENYTVVPGATTNTGTKTGAWATTVGTLWSKSKDTYSSKMEYDEHQNVTKETKTYKAGSSSSLIKTGDVMVLKYEYTYDDHGNIQTQKSYQDGEYKSTFTFEYKYDEYGNILESTRKSKYASGTTGTMVFTYTYDLGLLVYEEHSASDDGLTIARTEYTYE